MRTSFFAILATATIRLVGEYVFEQEATFVDGAILFAVSYLFLKANNDD
jgi:hypothetical protein